MSQATGHHRLTRITTRTGDDGTTGLGDGSRVPKHSVRIQALGDVDELNCALGMLRAQSGVPDAIDRFLHRVQHELFDLGAELAIPGHTTLADEQVRQLEVTLDVFNADLEPLREFVLPGGTQAAAQAHVARAQCRRAERSVLALHEVMPVGEPMRLYLNRLSDVLFVVARHLNRAAGQPDVLWRGRESAER